MKKNTILDYSRMIDHTNLKPNVTAEDMNKLCNEAIKYQFKMVAINQVQSKVCSNLLKETNVNVGAAIAFPLGQTTIEAKKAETKDAIKNGANEIDYVVNLTKVKEQNWDYIEEEMKAIVDICKKENVISKVIFENYYLENHEIIKLSKIAKKIQPNFIKTSTGFAPTGATVDDVKLMKQSVGDAVQVKAAGGIRDAETFIKMVEAGATRIGTSAGINIINELKKNIS